MRKKTKIIIGIITAIIVMIITVLIMLFVNNSPKLMNINGTYSPKTNVAQKNGKDKNNTDDLNPISGGKSTNSTNSSNTNNQSSNKNSNTKSDSNSSNGSSSKNSDPNNTNDNKIYSPTEKDKVTVDKQNDSTPTPVKEANDGYDIVYTDDKGKEIKEHVSNSDINSAKKDLNNNKINTDNMTDGFIAYKIVEAHVQKKELKDVITLNKMS